MSNKRGQAGRIGISGNASVSMEKISGQDAGETVPLPADSKDDLLLTKMVGEDSNGDFQRVATDTEGRIKVKDVQFDGTVDIGDLQILNTGGTKIDPATEETLSNVFKTSDFTESRNVRELQNETGTTSGTDSGGGSLPANNVADGKAVSVKAQFGNTGKVLINGDYPLLEGDEISLQVGNTDQISYTTENGTEGVAFIVEG